MSLPFTLRDGSGNILLAKGHRIETEPQLAGMQNRSKIYVEFDETNEGVRAMMTGINELNRVGAPLKDFYKYLSLKDPTKSADKEAGTLIERWDDVESMLQRRSPS